MGRGEPVSRPRDPGLVIMGALAMPLDDAGADRAGERRVWFAVACGAIAIAALRAFWVGPMLLIDPDLGWHLAIGEAILRDGSLPADDVFSWTASGEAYQLTQWGGEAVLAAAHRLGGAAALHMLCAATLAGCVVIAFSLARLFQARPLDAFSVAAMATLPIWATAARPQMFSFLLAGALLYLLIRGARAQAAGWFWAVVPLLAVWANLHGAFTIGALAAGVGALIVAGRMWQRDRQGSGTVMLAAACGLMATFANPYGSAAWTAAWDVAQLWTTRLAIIVEWRPTSLASGVGIFFMLFAGAILIGLARRRAPLVAYFAWLCGTAFAMLAVRNVPIAAMAMAALAGLALSRQAPRELPTDRSVVVFAPVLAAVLCAAAVFGFRAHDGRMLERQLYPVAAAAFLDSNRVHGRLWNELEHGGWWIANAPHRPVSIDGRLDLYGDARYFAFVAVRDMRPGWLEQLGRYDPDVIVIRSAAPLRQGLLAISTYALVHEADGTSVLVKRTASYAELIRNFERTPVDQPLFDAGGRPRFVPV